LWIRGIQGKKEERGRERGGKWNWNCPSQLVFSGLKHWIDEKKLIKIKTVMIIIITI
jgi:hypothetical protein